MKLRTALIGLGSMGQKHLNALQKVDEIDLVAVVDSVPTRRIFAGDVPFFDDVAEMIANRRPEAVAIVTPTITHEETALLALEGGIHVLVEKPIAHSEAAAKRLLAAALAANVVLHVGHNEQYNAAFVDARRRVDAGEIGDIVAINSRRFGPYPKRITDVGVTLDLGIHDFELILSLVDSPVRNVHGFCASKSEVGLDEHIVANIKFGSGVTATVEASWICHRHERSMLFVGTRGSILANLGNPHLSVTRGNNAAVETLVTEEFPIERTNALAAQWRTFAACTTHGCNRGSCNRAIAALNIATQLIQS